MSPIVKRALVGSVALVGVALGTAGGYAAVQCSHFDESMDRVYAVPLPSVVRSSEPAVVARGKHLVESVAACASRLCHGSELAGGLPVDVGPIGTFIAPNITMGNLGAAYSDGELARLIQHGIKKDGRSVRFMPAQEFGWLPDADVTAIVSYLRTVPPSDHANGATEIKPLGKVLDRRDQMAIDVARRIDHDERPEVPLPEPTAAYGAFLTRSCTGCHGEHFSGGRIPGAPSSMPIPLDLTPDATGLKDWTFADFETLMRKAVRKNGKALDPFMPVDMWRNYDDVEMHAVWAFLRTLPPTPFGNR